MGTSRAVATKRRSRAFVLWLFVIVAIGVSYCLIRLVVIGCPQTYEDESMHFKYGSIGSDNLRRGIPYDIWRVLPEMFHQHLPKGKLHNYGAFGLITDKRDGQNRPIGFSKRWHLGVGNVVGLNCAFCHVSTVRQVAGGPHKMILGMPANTVDAEAFFRFLFDVADDPEFTVEKVMTHINQKGLEPEERPLGYWQEFIQRRIVVPLFIRGLKNLKHTFSFLDRRPTPFGPGRVDTWAAYKVLRLQEPAWFMEYLPEWFGPYIDMDAGPVTGLADFPALWQEKVAGGALHWDGNTRVREERNITAALGTGVTPATLDLDSLRRIGRWMESDLKAVEYHKVAPPSSIITVLLGHGESLFNRHCYDCHHEQGERIRTLEPVDPRKLSPDSHYQPLLARPGLLASRAVCTMASHCALQDQMDSTKDRADNYLGTDPERLLAFTEKLSDKLNEIRHLSVWRLENYWKTQGYANVLLTGIWLRAPYLHNGSVPTLWHLVQDPSKRPTEFCRGNDLYDWKKVGFEWDATKDNCQGFFKYQTKLKGNGNGGHLYGTMLSDPEKEALIEYLKTL
jgi:hypothetical protein